MKDFIVRRSFPLPDGSYTLTKDQDVLKTVAKVNAESGYIYGYTAEIGLYLNSRWELNSQLTNTKGRNIYQEKNATGILMIDTLLPTSHIPPVFGQTSLTFNSGKFKTALTLRYQGEKAADEYAVGGVTKSTIGQLVLSREGTEDNIEQFYWKINEAGKRVFYGAKSWTTVNLYTSWILSERLSVNLALENIFDVHYRPFSSGLSGQGRNIIASFSVSLAGK